MQMLDHFEKELASLIARRARTLQPGELRSALLRAANRHASPAAKKAAKRPREAKTS